MFESYIDVRNWLENFIPQVWTKKELGLERIRHLLRLLGNPQDKFKSIHVAGTSGKGSTAFFIAKLLQESGKSEFLNPKSETNHKFQKFKKVSSLEFRVSSLKQTKVGLHLSPHLVDLRERMQTFQSQKSKVKSQKYSYDSLIPMDKFIELFNEIQPVVERIQKEKSDLTPSYFEILVAASFLYFAQEKVDWAVVEVGLGGRLDATNVLQPQLTVITNVGLDHTDVLGRTVEEIAFEKAGIIKSNVPIITRATGKALKTIERVAKEKKAPLIKIDTRSPEKALKSDIFRSVTDYIDIERSFKDSFAYQNKLLALATVGALGIKFTSGQILKAFNVQFPGRFEEVASGVILDGAHNPDKIKFLIRWIKKHLTTDNLQLTKEKMSNVTGQVSIVLIIAFKKGKAWKKIIDLLISQLPIKKVIATQFYAVTDMGQYQAVEPEEIARYIKSVYRLPTTVYSDSQEAVFGALRLRSLRLPSGQALDSRRLDSNQLILVTGSLYFVGEARTLWYLPEF